MLEGAFSWSIVLDWSDHCTFESHFFVPEDSPAVVAGVPTILYVENFLTGVDEEGPFSDLWQHNSVLILQQPRPLCCCP